MTKKAALWVAVSDKAQADDDRASLPQQEADLRALAVKFDWDVADVLIVPGFSRRYLSWEKFAADALRDKMDAPTRMLHHWAARDLDVIAFWDGSRFGRSQSLFARFVEEAIEAGIDLYSWKDGWITRQNYRGYVALGGYASAEEIDKLVERTRIGREGNARRGLFIGRHFFSHVARRDDLGRQTDLIVNEQFRRFFLDLAELLLQQEQKDPATGDPLPRLSWSQIAFRLNDRGHRTPTGKPWTDGYLQQVIYHPLVWGHAGYRYSHQSVGWHWNYYDATAPVPEGTQMAHHTVPPVYEGTLATRLQAELMYRHSLGPRRSATGRHMFSGLMVCQRCGYAMTVSTNGAGLIYWRCDTRFIRNRYPHRRAADCDNRKIITSRTLQAWWTARFQEARDYGLAVFTSSLPAPDTLQAAQLVALDQDIALLKGQLDRWINELSSDLVDRVRRQIRDRLNEADERLHNLEAQRAALIPLVSVEQDDAPARQAALQTALAAPDFWELPAYEINRQLRAILGPYRLIVDAGVIVAIGKL